MVKYLVLTGLVDEMISPSLPKADDVSGPLYGLHMWMLGALAAEPDPVELSERGPVTRWIGYAFGQPRITKTDAAALLPLQPGDPNPLFQVTDAVVREGGSIELGSSDLELATAYPITREEWKNPGYTQALVLTGGDSMGLQVYFEVDDVTDEIPTTFPNRTYSVLSDPDDLDSGVDTVWFRENNGLVGKNFSSLLFRSS